MSETPNNLLIILNDNDMSISNSVGGMKRYLLNLHTSSAYNDCATVWRAASRVGAGCRPRVAALIRLNNAFKSFLSDDKTFSWDSTPLFRSLRRSRRDLARSLAPRPASHDRAAPVAHQNGEGKGYDRAESDPVVVARAGQVRL